MLRPMAIAQEPLNPPAGDSDAVTPAPPHAPTPALAAPARRIPPRALIAAGLSIAGGALVVAGWYGAAHTNIVSEQIPYLISGGLLGVALLILAGIVAASATTHAELRGIREELARTQRGDTNLAMTLRPVTATRVLIVPSGRTYHAPGCPIPEGKTATTLPRDEAVATGFTACKLCAEA